MADTEILGDSSEDSGSESASGFEALTPEEAKAKLMMNGPDSSGLPRLPIEAPEAEPAPGAAPEAVAAPPEAVAYDPEDAKFADEFGNALAGARSLAEIKEIATAYLAGLGAVEDFVIKNNALVSPEKGANAKDRVAGWFEPIAGDARSQLLVDKIEKARELLDRRGAVKRALDKMGLKKDKKRKDGEYDAAWEAAQEHKRNEEAETRRLAEEAEAAVERLRLEKIAADRAESARLAAEEVARRVAAESEAKRLAEEAADRVLEGPDAFKDYIQEQKMKATGPLMADLAELQRDRREALKDAGSLPYDLREPIEARYAVAEREILKKVKQAVIDADKKTAEDREKLVDMLFTERQALKKFATDPKVTMHLYDPDSSMESELAAMVAAANGYQIKAHEDPLQIDDYYLKHDKGTPTHMQRLVYKTEDHRIMLVEDWDKSSGKLKRQMLVKGDALLVPDYDNEKLTDRERKKRIKKNPEPKMVLSNRIYEDEVYKKAGAIDSKKVVADSSTSVDDAYPSFVRNLTRAGGVSLATAKDLASPRRKSGGEKGFITMLMENLGSQVKRAA